MELDSDVVGAALIGAVAEGAHPVKSGNPRHVLAGMGDDMGHSEHSCARNIPLSFES